MDCHYVAAGRCRSCTWMGRPYAVQLADKLAATRAALAQIAPGMSWAAPLESPESGFRNKAKLAVGGVAGAPTLGILDAAGRGVDLTGCGLYEPGLAAGVETLAAFVAEAGLTPYDLGRRSGELKYVLVTHSPDGELMVRFVLRSQGQVGRLRRALPALSAAVPGLAVVSANLQPEHKAVLEGEHEVGLSERTTLPMRLGDVTLHLRYRSFFQTNTVVAQGLYAQAAEWSDEADPASVWDLYCGVGGFALHCAGADRDVVGVESSSDAVESARQSAREAGLGERVRFVAADATRAVVAQGFPDLVVVNPPRRGIGPDLARLLEESTAQRVLYSSCNPATLARDLAAMPSLRPRRARLFDMFPQTDHAEVLVELVRG